ncbi:hypothetical protein [Catalinimonas niigatensis]|uniref:hypothetical protein n=1 Tax=Catalinimonas niigatensis TaxID=1397264 RepID=UPI00266557E8|nr:hypothetical protein [Catalinimonas niigatensis]WPP50739.1 hypothetical protein PZB72_29170 [Catalinimonas niigatensis]
MKKSILSFSLLFFAAVVFQACSGGSNSSTEMENTDIVESGTYTGTADRVDAEEQEIYVETEEGQMLELYFTEQTSLTQNGQSVSFDALQQGQQLEVEVEKKGQRLEPVAVRIIE